MLIDNKNVNIGKIEINIKVAKSLALPLSTKAFFQYDIIPLEPNT